MFFSVCQHGRAKCQVSPLSPLWLNAWMDSRDEYSLYFCDAAWWSEDRNRNWEEFLGCRELGSQSSIAKTTEGRRWGGEEKEVRTDPDLLAQLVIKEALSSHCIMQAKISACYRWKMTALQTQILSVSLPSSSSLPPPSLYISLSLRMDEFNTEVVRNKGRFPHWSPFFTLSDSWHKNQASLPRPPLILPHLPLFLALWPFLSFRLVFSLLSSALSFSCCTITEASHWLLKSI